MIIAFVLSALLISASQYLVLDMDIPFAAMIQISDAPLQRTLAELQR
jgi:ABC-type proline/glycine betaine transport system ATPase subunit